MISEEMQKKIEVFEPYMISDDIGDWVQISDDAPQEAKRAYDEFMAEQAKAEKKGLKV